MSLVSVNQGLRGSKVLGKSLKRIKTQMKLSTGQNIGTLFSICPILYTCIS